MRAIDADALMETINRHCYPVQHDMTSIEPGMTCMGILQAIQEQPTIEPERKSCESCRYNHLEWNEKPCDSCTMGGETNHWKPTIEPERKKGKWIKYGEDFCCSECGSYALMDELDEGIATYKSAFCPNCGTDMRGEEDERTY